MWILDFLSLFNNELIINIFTILLIFLFLLNIFSFKFKDKYNWNEKYLEHVGGIYLSIGVFGTFLGITVGLLGFNVENIEESIPPLLEGLKISFLTSILGVFFNIINQKLSLFLLPRQISDETEILNKILDYQDKLYTIEKSNKHFIEEQLKKQEENQERNYNIQLENQNLFKSEFKRNEEWQNNFYNLFKEFNENISKNASEQIVEALNKVIEDFNENMVSQFGDNFKHLNQGIDNLIDWQENYKTLVTDELKLIETSNQKVLDLTKSLEEIKQGYENFVDITNKIKETNTETEKLNTNIQDNINTTTQVLNNQKETTEIIEKSFSNIQNKINETTNSFEGYIKNFQNIQNSISQSSEEIKELARNATEEQKMMIQKVLETHKKEVDEALEQAINDLGNNLADLSEKFVEDYLPLTEKLRSVVRIAEGIDH